MTPHSHYKRARKLAMFNALPVRVAVEFRYACAFCAVRCNNAGTMARHESIHKPLSRSD